MNSLMTILEDEFSPTLKAFRRDHAPLLADASACGRAAIIAHLFGRSKASDTVIKLICVRGTCSAASHEGLETSRSVRNSRHANSRARSRIGQERSLPPCAAQFCGPCPTGSRFRSSSGCPCLSAAHVRALVPDRVLEVLRRFLPPPAVPEALVAARLRREVIQPFWAGSPLSLCKSNGAPRVLPGFAVQQSGRASTAAFCPATFLADCFG
jgi:hypothetical protein